MYNSKMVFCHEQAFVFRKTFSQRSEMAAEVESSHGEKPVYRKMAEYKKKIALVEVILE